MRTGDRIRCARAAAILCLILAGGCRSPPPDAAGADRPPAPLASGPEPGENAPPKRRLVPERWSNSLGMEFRLAPAGKFSMEIDDPDAARGGRRGPSRRPGRAAAAHSRPVELTTPFYIGIYEVRDSEFREVLGEGPAGQVQDWRLARDPDRPAVSVSWEEAERFCEALSRLPAEESAGRLYRLPTEAEWVRAHGTGPGTPTWFEEVRVPLRWWVGEICADWYDPSYPKRMPETDPTGPPHGEERVCLKSWSHPDPILAVYTLRIVAEVAPEEDDSMDGDELEEPPAARSER